MFLCQHRCKFTDILHYFSLNCLHFVLEVVHQNEAPHLDDMECDQVKTACALVGKRMKMLEAFQTNVAGLTVCDKCMQPINPSHSSQSLLQLEADLITSRQEHQRFQEVHIDTNPVSSLWNLSPTLSV